MGKTARTARRYEELLERVQALPEGDAEREDLEGELVAWLYQLALDAQDAHAEHARWLDALPEEDEITA